MGTLCQVFKSGSFGVTKRSSENSFNKRLTCGDLFAMINLNSRSTFKAIAAKACIAYSER